MLTHNWIVVGENGDLIYKLMVEDSKSGSVICSPGFFVFVRENIN